MTKPDQQRKAQRPHGGEQPDQELLDRLAKDPVLIVTWVDGKMVETWVPADAPNPE